MQKRQRQEWELEELEGKKVATESGVDYDRVKSMNMQADIAEKLEAAKRRKKNPDTGFASELLLNYLVISCKNCYNCLFFYIPDYEAMSMRQYERLTNGLKPNMESYEQMKQVV